MKATFKPLRLAAAITAATIGGAGMVNAQSKLQLADNAGLGDLAIVPYYTVQESWSTGVSVINSSDQTQVVKIRLRRATDSMDALDFNVVMSPEDVWTGYVQRSADDTIKFYSNDKSCTVPAMIGGSFTMPSIYRAGANEGYIEVFGMGATYDEAQPIAIGAKHDSNGVPANCAKVRENFIRGTNTKNYGLTAADVAPRKQGVVNSTLTMQTAPVTLANPNGYVTSSYIDTGNVLKVSFFIKDDASGTEFGNDAVHIANFMDGASITNQKQGINEGDLQGFDHPDLNGGAPTSNFLSVPGAASRGSYVDLRYALGANSVINDWSANSTELFSVDTDWVVTTPGQYLMTALSVYIDSLEAGGDPCGYSNTTGDWDQDDYTNDDDGFNCDFRDIPLTVSASVWDREEQVIEADPEDLVVSPQPPGEVTVTTFEQEVNVVSWGTKLVLDSARNVIIPVPAGAEAGWARVSVEPNDKTDQAICDFTNYGQLPLPYLCEETESPVPLVGVVVWERNFGANPNANYGRMVEHSYNVGYTRK